MSIEISDVSATRKQCVVVYPFDEFQKDYQQKVRNFRGHLRGFRPGKVPRHVVEKQCGLGFKQELVDTKMRAAWKEITDQYQPLGSPDITVEPEEALTSRQAKESDLSMTLVFDVPPTITPFALDQLGLTIEELAEPTKDDRAKYLRHLARANGTEVESDKPVALGDIVYADITYVKDDRQEQDLRLIIDEDEIHPDFVKQLKGKKVGAELEFEYTPISYPEGKKSSKKDKAEALAVKVHVKKVVRLDEASEEKVYETLAPGETWDKVKWDELITKNLKAQAYKKHFRAQEQKVLDHLAGLHDVEIPQAHYEGKEFSDDNEKAEWEKSLRLDYLLERYGRFLEVKMPQDGINFFAELFCEESNIPLGLFQHFVRSEKNFQQQFYTMVSQRMVTKFIIDTLTPNLPEEGSQEAAPEAKKAQSKPKKKEAESTDTPKKPAAKKAAPKKEAAEKKPEAKKASEPKKPAVKKEKAAPTGKKAAPKKKAEKTAE